MAISNRIADAFEPPRWVTPQALEENLREVPRAAAQARQATRETVAAVAATIRQHPLQTVAAVAVVGTVAALLLGLIAGRFVRR